MFTDEIDAVVGLSDDALDVHLRELEEHRRRLDARMAAAVAVADHRRLYGRDGHRSVSGYLRATLDRSSADTARLRSASELVAEHTEVGDAWLAGEIGLGHVAVIARGRRREIRERYDEFVPLLLDTARTVPVADLQTCVDRIVRQLDDDGTFRHEAHERRSAHLAEVDGSLHGRIEGGDPMTTAIAIKVFDVFVQREYRADLDSVCAARSSESDDATIEVPDLAPGVTLPRTAGQRRFDAFIAMTRAAGAALDHGLDPDDWSPALRIDVLFTAEHFAQTLADHAIVAPGILDDAEDLLADPASTLERRCETSDGIEVDPHDVLRHALDARIRRVVVDSAGVVVDLGRTERLFTGAAREAAMLLVERCEHPGCEIPAAWCEIDHAEEWERDDGRTDQANARVRCRWHNQWKHRTRARSLRAVDGRTYTTRPDGTIILPVGHRPPVFPIAPGPEPQHSTMPWVEIPFDDLRRRVA